MRPRNACSFSINLLPSFFIYVIIRTNSHRNLSTIIAAWLYKITLSLANSYGVREGTPTPRATPRVEVIVIALVIKLSSALALLVYFNIA